MRGPASFRRDPHTVRVCHASVRSLHAQHQGCLAQIIPIEHEMLQLGSALEMSVYPRWQSSGGGHTNNFPWNWWPCLQASIIRLHQCYLCIAARNLSISRW